MHVASTPNSCCTYVEAENKSMYILIAPEEGVFGQAKFSIKIYIYRSTLCRFLF